MHQVVENTAYCLNCTHQWAAMWSLQGESTLECPQVSVALERPRRVCFLGVVDYRGACGLINTIRKLEEPVGTKREPGAAVKPWPSLLMFR